MKERSRTSNSERGWKRLGARLSIWSIRRHDALLGLLRVSAWSFSAVVLLAAVIGRLDLETALRIIAFGGLVAVVLLTGLVLTRRNVLLAVEDPDLKSEAHRVMMDLIRSRTSAPSAGRNESERFTAGGAGRCRLDENCGS